MKEQSGITLVALVITIIVLLILAGVSISLVMGNNGILTQASTAVSTQEESTALSEVEMAASSAYMNYSIGKASDFTKKKSNYYTRDEFTQNCISANGIELKTEDGRDAGYVGVKYTAKSTTYYFKIALSNNKTTEISSDEYTNLDGSSTTE